jgi:hypothetical protein
MIELDKKNAPQAYARALEARRDQMESRLRQINNEACLYPSDPSGSNDRLNRLVVERAEVLEALCRLDSLLFKLPTRRG